MSVARVRVGLGKPHVAMMALVIFGWTVVSDVRAQNKAIAEFMSAALAPLTADAAAFDLAPTVLFVDADALGANDGSTWVDAYTVLQDALAHAAGSPGVVLEIWVAAGTYTPGVRSCSIDADCDGPGGGICSAGMCVWNSPRAQSFRLQSGVGLFGGFNTTETSFDQRDITANVTILTGDLAGNDLGGPTGPTHNENSYHVVVGDGLTDATLDGFTITGGRANGVNPDDRGAGLRFTNSTITVANCIITENSAIDAGAGVFHNVCTINYSHCKLSANESKHAAGMLNLATGGFISDCRFLFNLGRNNGGGLENGKGSSPIIRDCVFEGNTASFGAGARAWSSAPEFFDCVFQDNTASFSGGGVDHFFANASYIRCQFIGNTAVDNGGGMRGEASSPLIDNCVFRGNSAGKFGGAIFNDISSGTTSNPSVVRSVFELNTALFRGGAIYNANSSHPIFTNCKFRSNFLTAVGGDGGAMLNDKSNPLIVNCIFVNNSTGPPQGTGSLGGAIYNIGTSAPSIINCSFTGNSSTDGLGGGIAGRDTSVITIVNSVLWGDTPNRLDAFGNASFVVSNSIIQGGFDGGTNILDIDPSFVDARGPDNISGTEDDDLRLRQGSPGIDAGDTDSLPQDTFDLDHDGIMAELISLDLAGNARVRDDDHVIDTGVPGPGGVVDIGAFELNNDCNENGLRDEDEIAADPSLDCNGNWIPDLCEIDANSFAPGGPFFCKMNCDPDCNSNGIPDACDIQACGVDVPFDPSCDDCNNNGVPDSCDIADGTSDDVGGDGIPDECLNWEPPAKPDNLWSTPQNWDVGIVPNNDNDVTFAPTIAGPQAMVTLDIEAEIDALRLLDGGTLQITGGSLTFAQAGMLNDGLVTVGTARSIIAGADIAFTGSGALRLDAPDAALFSLTGLETISNSSTIAGEGLITAALINQAGGGIVRADVPSGTLAIVEGVKQNDGMFEAVFGGTLDIRNTNVTGDGFYVADGGTIAVRAGSTTPTVSGQFMEITNGGTFDIDGDASLSLSGDLLIDVCRTSAALMSEAPSLDSIRSRGTVAGGCTPPRKPKLNVSASASVTVQGSLAIMTDAEVVVTAAFSDIDDAGITLAGNFENQSTSPSDFNWTTGSLSLIGTTDQTFEVAGEDFGAVACGFENNFAIGTLEVQSGAVLDLVNNIANGPGGAGSCQEALYVDTLILRTGSVLRPSGGNLYYRRLIGNGTIDAEFGCGDAIKALMPDHDCDTDVDLRDVAAFMVCFGVIESDTNWASCQWSNLSVTGVDEAIDLDDYTLFSEVLLGAAGGPK